MNKSFNKKKVTKSIGPNQRPGLGRAEMLTNGYKSLRNQGLLRATKIPDGIERNIHDESIDEAEANQQS